MVQRQDIEFTVERDVTVRGWLFVPDGPGPHPGITMAHGFAGVKEHGLEGLARLFADAGFVLLVHDHRGFGASDGSPRFDVDPWVQIADWRRAISFLESLPAVDPDRIGLWGTSYAGGHAVVLGATDRRLRAVVAQVPTISGYEQSLRRVAPDQVFALEAAFIDDERRPVPRRATGHPGGRELRSRDPRRLPLPGRHRLLQPADARGRVAQQHDCAILPCRTELRAGSVDSRVSPTPLLMIVALHDTITVADLALAAYERALQPKKLVTIAGGHFDPYLDRFAEAGGATRGWFTEHLTKPDTHPPLKGMS